MSVKKNILLNNDGLYATYRDNYKDSIDFFTEKKIEVNDEDSLKEDKNEPIEGMEAFDLTYIQGLENLVKQFSQHNIDPKLIELHQGSENDQLKNTQGSETIYIDTDPYGNSIIREQNDCLYIIEDNIKKLQKRVADVDKKRRKGSIRTKPIKMKSIVKKLGTTKNVTSDPLWVPAAVGDAIKFTGDLMTGYYSLAKFIDEAPKDRHEMRALTLKMFADLGKTIVGGSGNKSVYTSDPLPGNVAFNLKFSSFGIGTVITTSYTDVKTSVNVASETCLPTAHLIDKCIDALENYLYLFTKSKNDLIKLLISTDNLRKKSDKLKSGPRTDVLFNVLRIVSVARRLLKAMVKLANRVTDALYDFILQGIK